MKPPSITNYFQNENQAFGSLAAKLNQLKQWNGWLADSLPNENTLLQHCQIVSLSSGSLIVIADSAHWVTRLRFYIPELLPKLRAYPGLEKIRSICCKVQPNHFKSAPKKTNPPLKKLSQENASMLRKTAQKISDSKLREILERIAERVE